jgi:membrane fusion protein, multidrug efflux system
MKKSVFIFVAMFVAVSFLAGCSSGPNAVQAAPEVVSGLQLVSVERVVIPDAVEAVGSVRAAQTTQIAAQVMGAIVTINVREGDRVARGQVLILIDDTQSRALSERAQAAVLAAQKDIVAAQSEATLAESTFKRYESLWQKNSVSAQEFDEVKARSQAAQARLELARAGEQQARAALAQANAQLGYSRVRAPFDGVVTEKRTDIGTIATPGMPLLTVEDTHRYQLEVTVDESQAAAVKIGAMVPVVLDALPRPVTAKVTQVVPASDPGSHSFVVKLDLPTAPDWRSGLFGRARFPTGKREALLVPSAAVVSRGQLQNAYVVAADGTAALRYVTVTRVDDQRTEVLSGLQAGERVIADPGSRDLAGKVVR